MRITRHPQAFGQALWCAAHLLWIGSSFMLTTSAALMAHHLFSCWHGDYRLRRKYGEVAHCLCCFCKLGVCERTKQCEHYFLHRLLML